MSSLCFPLSGQSRKLLRWHNIRFPVAYSPPPCHDFVGNPDANYRSGCHRLIFGGKWSVHVIGRAQQPLGGSWTDLPPWPQCKDSPQHPACQGTAVLQLAFSHLSQKSKHLQWLQAIKMLDGTHLPSVQSFPHFDPLPVSVTLLTMFSPENWLGQIINQTPADNMVISPMPLTETSAANWSRGT